MPANSPDDDQPSRSGQPSRPGTVLSRYLYSFHPRSLPMMARLSYTRELVSISLLPLMLSTLQSGTIAVFVKKTFAEAPGITPWQLNFAVGLVAASKAIGNLTSFLWAAASQGKPKVRLIMLLQLLTAVVIGMIALAPRTAAGLWMVTLLCMIAWMIWSGVMTLRVGVWRANYHHSYRASVAGKLSTVQALIIAAMGAAIGYSLDLNPMTYRVFFPVLAVIGALGATAYGRVPFRGEHQQLANERSSAKTRKTTFSPAIIYRVLRSDRSFRHYMSCMFVLGIGNLMLHPILAIVLADQFHVGYQTGIAITTVIPLLCMTAAIPFWSRRLERSHVIQYRAVHAWSFVGASSLVILGVATNQIVPLFIASVVIGISWGGGVLAWNLGHQHFAPRDRDTEYMGVHITLTGLRGFIGPMLAVQLYGWLAARDFAVGAFLVCLAMNVIGAMGFVLLSRRMLSQTEEPPAKVTRPRDRDRKPSEEFSLTTSK